MKVYNKKRKRVVSNLTYNNLITSNLINSHELADAKVRKTLKYDEFRLQHYAGNVTYNVTSKSIVTS